MANGISWPKILAPAAAAAACAAALLAFGLAAPGAQPLRANAAAKFLIDHFACYGPGFGPFKDRKVVFRNQFTADRGAPADGTVDVGRPVKFCAPATRRGEKFLRPSLHLTCYQVRQTGGLHGDRTVDVTNQFGQLRIALRGSAETICLPSSKALGGAVPGKIPARADHYVCYRVRAHEPSFAVRRVRILDQFGAGVDAVVKPERLCLPSGKRLNATGPVPTILHPADHLLCYRVGSNVRSQGVALRNQFGVAKTVGVSVRIELCVPSLKRLLS